MFSFSEIQKQEEEKKKKKTCVKKLLESMR